MSYVNREGRLVQQRPFSLGTVVDYFWGAVRVVNLFFRSLLHLDEPTRSQTRGRYGNAPGRGMGSIGRVGGSGGAPAPPPACFGGS